MQSPPASDRAGSPDHYVVRLSGALAALLGQAEGDELPEDDLLGWLRAKGLITYPSPLLGPLEGLPDILAAEVLPRLDPTDLAMFARVGPASRAAAVASGLPRAGAGEGVPLKLKDFVGSVQRLAWAKANDCPWVAATCALAARSGHPEVLRWAREHGCDWDEMTCADAAAGGHLEVLVWAREHGCPWMDVDEDGSERMLNCCKCAAAGGHLEVLKWLREQDCPWNESTYAYAAIGGHLEVLQWLLERDCPWDAMTCACAANGGHLEVLKWAREHHCPWDARTRRWAAENGHLELLRWAVEHGAP